MNYVSSYVSGRNLTDMTTTNNYNTSMTSFINSSLASLSYGAISVSLVTFSNSSFTSLSYGAVSTSLVTYMQNLSYGAVSTSLPFS